MNAFIAALTEAFVIGICKALAKPGVLLGLLNAWGQAHEDRLIIASKPTKDDENFIKDAKTDGWSAPVVKP